MKDCYKYSINYLMQASKKVSERSLHLENFRSMLEARGPDCLKESQVRNAAFSSTSRTRTHQMPCFNTLGLQVQLSPPASLYLACSLLQLRGRHTAATPHSDVHGNILLFNGATRPYQSSRSPLQGLHIFLTGAECAKATNANLGGDVDAGEIFDGLHIGEGCNDGQALMQALGQLHANVAELLSRVRGPWAVMYWQAATSTLWFGRDAIGKDPVVLSSYTRHLHGLAVLQVLMGFWEQINVLLDPFKMAQCSAHGLRESVMGPVMDCAGRRSLLVHFPDEACQDLCITSVSCPSTNRVEHSAHSAEIAESCRGNLAAAATEVPSNSESSEAPQFWEVGPSPNPHSVQARTHSVHAQVDQLLSSLASSAKPNHQPWSLCAQEVEPGMYSICFGDSRMLEGRASVSLQKQPWTNPLLYELAAYQRPASLIFPQLNLSKDATAIAMEAATSQVHLK